MSYNIEELIYFICFCSTADRIQCECHKCIKNV